MATSAMAWDAPIGIPDPAFGLDESVMDYVGETYDYVGDGGVETYRKQ